MREDIRRSRELRAAMTEPEVILWSRLKQLRTEGFRFRRQAPFRGYYLDFVCFERRVVVEVDGATHGDEAQAAHDLIRDAVLAREGFRVLRVWNPEVRRNLSGVMYSILRALDEADAPPRSPRGESPSP